jgi:hypothetical protein
MIRARFPAPDSISMSSCRSPVSLMVSCQCSPNENQCKRAGHPVSPGIRQNRRIGISIILFGGASPACGRGPGYPLQFLSFTRGKASGIFASIPCAALKRQGCRFRAMYHSRHSCRPVGGAKHRATP